MCAGENQPCDTVGVTRTVYRAPVALGIRGVGFGAVGLGLAVVGATLVAAATLPGWLEFLASAVLAVLALGSAIVLVVGVLRLAGRGTRLVLDDDGFTNATGPRSGVRKAAWRDVRKVQADGPVVSVDLAGNKQSLIRTGGIDADPRELARELRARLNRDRGYRPLSG